LNCKKLDFSFLLILFLSDSFVRSHLSNVRCRNKDNWAVSRQNQHHGFATSMYPDQPAHPRSLIRIDAVRLPSLLQVEKLIANSMDPDQTAQMHRLVWIHAGRKPIMLVLSWHGSIAFWHLNLLVSIMQNNQFSKLYLNRVILIFFLVLFVKVQTNRRNKCVLMLCLKRCKFVIITLIKVILGYYPWYLETKTIRIVKKELCKI
jgi:hypothetical protein